MQDMPSILVTEITASIMFTPIKSGRTGEHDGYVLVWQENERWMKGRMIVPKAKHKALQDVATQRKAKGFRDSLFVESPLEILGSGIESITQDVISGEIYNVVLP